jgi:hypothetical protein
LIERISFRPVGKRLSWTVLIWLVLSEIAIKVIVVAVVSTGKWTRRCTSAEGFRTLVWEVVSVLSVAKVPLFAIVVALIHL